MSAVATAFAAGTDEARELAEDLRCIAWLHATEHDSAAWLALRGGGFPAELRLGGGEAAAAMSRALDALAEERTKEGTTCDDLLAADFAGIYLTHALRASPFESVWRDEDHLILQGPTFEVREFYKRYNYPTVDWRAMPDDHLVHELRSLAHLLDNGAQEAAADFLDRHLLQWLPDFAARVAQRADTATYAALALLTMDVATQLRDRIGGERPAPAADSVRTARRCAP